MADETVRDLDVNQIKRLIPHRYPFLFIDRVRDIVPFESAVGIKNVTANEPQFQGHFPERPILPGVMMVEAMAQAATVLAMVSMDKWDQASIVFFTSIDECRFRRPVEPGDVLELHLTVLRRRAKLWKMRGEARVGGALACEAVVAAMMDQPRGEG